MTVETDREPPRKERPKPRRLSDLFVEIGAQAGESLSVGEIIDRLGDRSFAAALLLFAALNLLPLPPGATFFTGAPLVLIAMQMVWGSPRVWLPKRVREKTLPGDRFRSAVAWIAPRLLKLEKLVRPRYWPFWHRQGEIIIGSLTLLLAIIITLPIPLGNWPPALAIAFISLALSERDGVMLAIGVFLSVAAVAIITLLAASATMFVNYLWHHFFSIID